MAGQFRSRHHWLFCIAAVAVWLALGWPVLQRFTTGAPVRGTPVSALWLVPFVVLGAAVLCAMIVKLRPAILWALLCIQLAAVMAMAAIVPWAGMSEFLVIIAWQGAMATSPARALAWVAFQTLAIIATLAQALNPDLCWVIGKALAVQLLLVFTAQALRRESEMARTLGQTNRELHAAQALIASTARDAERLRISRELHDAWGHELTALGLQLEIASHIGGHGRAKDHVIRARHLARDLLAKVRDVVAALRETEPRDLEDALEALARSVPAPAVHVEICPEVRVSPDQAHALVRCAQEAITNAVRHADASNLWLHVTSDQDGVRLVARNDGTARRTASAAGCGLLGMRERVESLGGKLAVRAEVTPGFTVDAWLPSVAPRTA